MHTIAQFQLLFIVGGVLLILAALPLLYNRVKPNPWYGFRIPKTLSDERIWYPANSYAAKGMILTGIITIAVAVVLRLTDVPPATYGSICTYVLVGGLLLTLVAALIYMKRIS